MAIPAIDVDALVVPVGLLPSSTSLEIPADVQTLGWYRFGPAPGDDGSSVIVGHVDSSRQGAGAFFRLRELAPGSTILVAFAHQSRRFTVVARREFAKSRLPADLFLPSGRPILTLITCGGAFDRQSHHYADNIVVYAVPYGSRAGE
jgi:LPXTG-site transpeptidase (sortase) family protein